MDISGQWPFARGWYAVARYNYSFLDSRLLEGLAGFEYNENKEYTNLQIRTIQATTKAMPIDGKRNNFV